MKTPKATLVTRSELRECLAIVLICWSAAKIWWMWSRLQLVLDMPNDRRRMTLLREDFSLTVGWVIKVPSLKQKKRHLKIN